MLFNNNLLSFQFYVFLQLYGIIHKYRQIYVQKGKGKQKFGFDKNSIKKDYIHTME